MQNLLTVMLAIGLKNELQSFINDYGIPVIAAFILMSVGYGIIRNLDLIVDKEGTGTREKGIMNVVWIVGFVIVALAILAGIVALVASKLSMTL